MQFKFFIKQRFQLFNKISFPFNTHILKQMVNNHCNVKLIDPYK